MFYTKCVLHRGRILPRQTLLRTISTAVAHQFKVAVIGAAGGIGKPLSLLLAQNPLVTSMALYDVQPSIPGVAEDLSHLNTETWLEGGYTGDAGWGTTLCGADVVVVPAGMPRKPGMSRDDLFNSNAKLVQDITCATLQYCPCALMALVTNPVNSVVPIANEVKKMYGYDLPGRVFGVTTLDMVRASTFVAKEHCMDPGSVKIPVVGGHSGTTIVPLLSQAEPQFDFSDADRDRLTKKIQEAGTEVVKAKAGDGSATLSIAFATARFVDSLLRAMTGEQDVVEYAYVQSMITPSPYFSVPLLLGFQGVQCLLDYGNVNPYEKKLIEEAIPQLKKEVQKGIDFVHVKKIETKDVSPVAACAKTETAKDEKKSKK